MSHPKPNEAAAAAVVGVGGGDHGGHYYHRVPVHPYYAARPLPIHVPHQQGMMSQQQPSAPQPLVHKHNQPPPAAPAPVAPAPAPVSVPQPQQRPVQQQRTGPTIVGGSGVTKTTSKSTTNNPATAASTANSKTNPTSKTTSNTTSSSTNKFHPSGRCVSDSLAILRAYAPPSYQLSSSKKRKTPQDHMHVLERVVPPLLLCAKNNVTTSLEEEGGEEEDDVDGLQGGEGENRKRAKSDSYNESGDGRGEGHVDGDNIQSASSAKTTTNIVITTKQDYHAQLQRQLAQHVHENQKLVQRRQHVFQSLVRLHELYETGLDGIARMNDLTFVPDNVMPK